ncbi:hypothetical protein ACU686_25575 [Yinghuangia aomiensis]
MHGVGGTVVDGRVGHRGEHGFGRRGGVEARRARRTAPGFGEGIGEAACAAAWCDRRGGSAAKRRVEGRRETRRYLPVEQGRPRCRPPRRRPGSVRAGQRGCR